MRRPRTEPRFDLTSFCFIFVNFVAVVLLDRGFILAVLLLRCSDALSCIDFSYFRPVLLRWSCLDFAWLLLLDASWICWFCASLAVVVLRFIIQCIILFVVPRTKTTRQYVFILSWSLALTGGRVGFAWFVAWCVSLILLRYCYHSLRWCFGRGRNLHMIFASFCAIVFVAGAVSLSGVIRWMRTEPCVELTWFYCCGASRLIFCCSSLGREVEILFGLDFVLLDFCGFIAVMSLDILAVWWSAEMRLWGQNLDLTWLHFAWFLLYFAHWWLQWMGGLAENRVLIRLIIAVVDVAGNGVFICLIVAGGICLGWRIGWGRNLVLTWLDFAWLLYVFGLLLVGRCYGGLGWGRNFVASLLIFVVAGAVLVLGDALR